MAVNISLLNSSSTNNINTNFERVATALADTVGRAGSTPNQMNADFDLNSNDLLNGGVGHFDTVLVDGVDVHELTGYRGWTPIYASEDRSGSIVLKLVDYSGGEGEKPTEFIGWYIGSTGFVQDINDATPFSSSGVADGDKGNVVVTSGGTVWTLDTDSVGATNLTSALANTLVVNVADTAALKALDTSRYTLAYLKLAGRQGMFQWFSGDMSAQVAPRSFTSTSVDSGADTVTKAGHRMKTGDALIVTATLNGLTANTYYYAIRTDSSTFALATSRANAIAGTNINLTGTSAMTFKATPDDLEGEIVLKTGAAKDGTAGAWVRCKTNPGEYDAMHFGLEVGGTTDNSIAINVAMLVAEEFGGGLVRLPAGNIYMTTTIYAKRYVFLQGMGKQATKLQWHGGAGTSYAVDGLDAWTDGAYPLDRTIFGISDLTLDGQFCSALSTLKGIRLGNNHRSAPVLNRVVIMQMPGHGIHFTADNWNIDFVDVELDTCGRLVTNSSGIYKDPGITDMNHVNFTRVRVEGCGTSSSTAGGMFIWSTALYTNRGWQFTDCQAEGNFGTDEVYFYNMNGIHFKGWYMETINTAGHTAGMEIENCSGSIHGAEIHAEAGSPLRGIWFKGASTFTVMDVNFGVNWPTAIIRADGTSIIRYANIAGAGSISAAGTASATSL